MEQILETDRLVLRDWKDQDLDRVFDIYRRWEVVRWLGKDPKVMEDISQAEQFIDAWNKRNSACKRWGVRHSGTTASWRCSWPDGRRWLVADALASNGAPRCIICEPNRCPPNIGRPSRLRRQAR
jgi:hypothetical protein